MRQLLGAIASFILATSLLVIVSGSAEALPPRIVLVSPEAWPSVIDPAVGGSLAVRATNLGESTGTLHLTGRPGQTVSNDEIVTFDLATLTPGNYELSLTLCDEPQGCRSNIRVLVVRNKPSINVWGNDRFLNENGDGLWESATPQVRLDPDVDVAVQWSVKAGSRLVAGPFSLSQEQIDLARTWDGIGVPIDAQAVGKKLPAGDYWFEMQTTGIEPDFTKTAVAKWEFHVSTASALTALTPQSTVFYPEDVQRGVAHTMVLTPRLDTRVLKYGGVSVEVIDADGKYLLGVPIDPADGVIRWNGYHYPDTGVGFQVAPEGKYRIRLSAWDDGLPKGDLVSAPFRLSHAHRTLVQVVDRKRKVAGTRIATLDRRAASVRAVRGSLIYRKHRNAEPPSGPLVRTVHKVRVRSPYLKSAYPILRLRGRWENEIDIDVRIVTPSGKVVEVISALMDRRHRYVFLNPRWIRPNGTVKFHLRWKGYGRGRVDSVAISRWMYRWSK